jgi:hypothetical protein
MILSRTYIGLLEKKLIQNDEVARYQVPMLWAIVSNTMPACFWLVFHILQNDEVRAKIFAEVSRFKDVDILDQNQLDSLIVCILD